jgi:hypothetical protein
MLAVDTADAQLLSDDPHLLEAAEDVSGHTLWQVDEAVIVADVYLADVAAFEAGLVGDCADNVAWLYAVGVTHFETKSFEVNIVVIATAAAGTRGVAVTIVVVVAITAGTLV